MNVALITSRASVPPQDREVRSTRFGNWPPDEDLPNRTNFRRELDHAVLHEETLVHRIWNVSSEADAKRLREMIAKYQGRHNHSIRVYFGLPDQIMPELLVVEKRGASISFSSRNRQQSLDSVILFKRSDLVQVVRNYFDVLWDDAARILQGGQLVPQGDAALKDYEAKFTTNQPSP